MTVLLIHVHRIGSSRSRRARGLRCVSWTAACLLLLGLCAPAGVAEEAVRQQMQGLDEQVQELKSDVLRIAAELSLLEERLLYPSNTQLAIFVAVEEGQTFRLDSLQLRIDGEAVAHHIYSFKELEALQKGGIQRVYTGNVPTGEHQLEISVAGKSPGGSEFSRTEILGFTKDAEPKLVGITLADGDSDGARIELGDW